MTRSKAGSPAACSPRTAASRRHASSRPPSASTAERCRRPTAVSRNGGSIAGRVGSGTVVCRVSPSDSPFRLSEMLSRRATELPGESPIAISQPVAADFSRLAPDERFFPLEEFTRHARVRLEPPQGSLAVRSPARPRGIARRDLPAPRRNRPRALARRDPRRQRRAAGPRPDLPDLRRSGGPRRDGVADVLRRAHAGAAGRRLDPAAPDGRRAVPIPRRSTAAASSSAT